jgi:pseudouridine synthase
MWPVGRLDWESDGLVLLTNDGELTHLLTHPSSHVDKVYQVKLRGVIRHDDAGLERMRRGVELDDGVKTSGASVTVEGRTDKHTWVQVILHEGRNRQIRRTAEAVGHTVLKLRRVAIGSLDLGGLKAGHWRGLTVEEVYSLYSLAGAEAPKGLRPSASILPGRPRVVHRKSKPKAKSKRGKTRSRR